LGKWPDIFKVKLVSGLGSRRIRGSPEFRDPETIPAPIYENRRKPILVVV
jgi:hypothetical protein